MGQCEKKYVKPIKITQKRMIRIINDKPYDYHTHELFHSSKISKMEDELDFNKAKLAHSIWYGTAPETIGSSLEKSENNQRRQIDFHIPNYKKKVIYRLPKVEIPKYWNLIPERLRRIEKEKNFKEEFKKWKISR